MAGEEIRVELLGRGNNGYYNHYQCRDCGWEFFSHVRHPCPLCGDFGIREVPLTQASKCVEGSDKTGGDQPRDK